MSEHDPTDLEGHDRKRQTAEEKAKLDARMAANDLKWVMNNKQGRRVMYRQLADTGIWHDGFDTNALVMARKAGMRLVGLKLLDEIMRICPGTYELMLQERNENA